MALDEKTFHIATKIYLGPDGENRQLFGRGIINLLRAIEDQGSLNSACKALHISYSKAWRLIQKVEELLGLSLITRGSTHSATLTDDGVELMYLFETLENEIATYAQKILEEELRDNPLFH